MRPDTAFRVLGDRSAFEAKCRDVAEPVVPLLLSCPLTPERIRAAHWNPRRPGPLHGRKATRGEPLTAARKQANKPV
ncbi:hypothetical protein ABIA33_005038 [Streptacidiphilus sp. MAP12-16]|uniref:hypothetical protein n=1 Tax=Streptacidiphilus sp. MAP12-16 TaxID=3156300 RepID=UPI003515F5D7